jgi:toxin ParE1/3/4
VSGWLLSVDARVDLRDILAHGVETWGERRTRQYLARLFELFDHLGANPGIGRHRPELRLSLRTFPHRPYVVVFLPWNDGIVVSRVLHGSMDYAKLFEDYDPLAGIPPV